MNACDAWRVKASGEHARLARAFGIAPTRHRFAMLTTGGAAFIGIFAPGALLVAGGLLAGLGGIEVSDRRAVQAGLREVEAWGFPVEGYRAWLLADEPTFEIELARDIDVDVFATSVRAIDDSVRVTRLGERRFRMITRRVALPSPRRDGPVVYVGDRELLHELHARLLAPLHADVGIRRMRMGDRDTLPAVAGLLAGGDEPAAASMGAFRDQALAAPPALQALVHEGGSRELPREALTLSRRDERVVYATGSAPHGVGTIIGFTVGSSIAGGGYGEGIGLAIGAVGGLIGGTVAMIQGNRSNARKIAQAVEGQGFPIEGYDLWLISGRPLLDIELVRPVDPGSLMRVLEELPRAYSVSVNAEVPWVEEVKWLDDRTVRIETRPTLVEPPSRIEPFYGGSHQMFGVFVQQVLGPLHRHASIVRVRMGGYLTRRV